MVGTDLSTGKVLFSKDTRRDKAAMKLNLKL
jgi:hypothetical protein